MKITKAQAQVLLEVVEEKIRSEHHIRISYDYLLGTSRDELLSTLTQLKTLLERVIRRESLLLRIVSPVTAVRDFHRFCSRRYG